MIAMTKNIVLKFSLATQAPAKYITNFPGVIGSGGGGGGGGGGIGYIKKNTKIDFHCNLHLYVPQ